MPPEVFRLYVPDIAAFSKITEFKGAESSLATGKIKRTKPCYGPQFDQLKALVNPEEVSSLKLTLAAPEWFHLRHQPGTAYDLKVYPDDS